MCSMILNYIMQLLTVCLHRRALKVHVSRTNDIISVSCTNDRRHRHTDFCYFLIKLMQLVLTRLYDKVMLVVCVVYVEQD